MHNYIYGAGGHGKVVLDAMQLARIDCKSFVDDKEILSWAGLSVLKLSDLVIDSSVYFHLAIGNCKVREAVAAKLDHANYFSVLHPSATIAKTAQIGIGTFLAAHSVVAPDAKVGNHCIINHGAVVDHDCLVGDYTHIAPQSSLGGGGKVGKGVLIGAGAMVLPNIEIADYAVIGAGAVVTKNVAPGIVVVGNPAKPIKLSVS
jgi:sugar O-acyltransferase (sialic acid O-acetyltransferase NeuD family)